MGSSLFLTLFFRIGPFFPSPHAVSVCGSLRPTRSERTGPLGARPCAERKRSFARRRARMWLVTKGGKGGSNVLENAFGTFSFKVFLFFKETFDKIIYKKKIDIFAEGLGPIFSVITYIAECTTPGFLNPTCKQSCGPTNKQETIREILLVLVFLDLSEREVFWMGLSSNPKRSQVHVTYLFNIVSFMFTLWNQTKKTRLSVKPIKVAVWEWLPSYFVVLGGPNLCFHCTAVWALDPWPRACHRLVTKRPGQGLLRGRYLWHLWRPATGSGSLLSIEGEERPQDLGRENLWGKTTECAKLGLIIRFCGNYRECNNLDAFRSSFPRAKQVVVGWFWHIFVMLSKHSWCRLMEWTRTSSRNQSTQAFRLLFFPPFVVSY